MILISTKNYLPSVSFQVRYSWYNTSTQTLKYEGFSSNIYGGSYTCTHDILFKMKMLSYLDVAYVFNNINVFIYQYL
jgi:hypothetical protein